MYRAVRSIIFAFTAALAAVCSCAGNSHACPLIDGLVDFNCDQKLKIVFTGDSIVAGYHDAPADYGGYPTRIGLKFPDAEVKNLGISGIRTSQLLLSFSTALSRHGSNKQKRALQDADLIIIDVGRNDFWEKVKPVYSYRNIIRLKKLLKHYVEEESGVAPTVIASTLLPTARWFQQPFISGINQLLLSHAGSTLADEIRLDYLSLGVLSRDGLHPDAHGYNVVANKVAKFLEDSVKTHQLTLRPDLDEDGIYDLFESSRFGTDPSNPDTDADGRLDGEEIFTNGTNPLVAD
ncbi:MAG: SGNH/GDSL hydrolase family protein [Oligoflexia bacterium]|nr:SGNH/GDSL hydrolase family protein [Oligoflexia bacterium]